MIHNVMLSWKAPYEVATQGSCGKGRLWFQEVVLPLLVSAQDGGQPAGGQLHVLIAGRGKREADVGAGEGRPRPLTVCNAARQYHDACLCQLQRATSLHVSVAASQLFNEPALEETQSELTSMTTV